MTWNLRTCSASADPAAGLESWFRRSQSAKTTPLEGPVSFNPMATSYFLSRQTLIPTSHSGMALWRDYLFTWMARNAAGASTFFNLPTNQVIEAVRVAIPDGRTSFAPNRSRPFTASENDDSGRSDSTLLICDANVIAPV